MVYGLYGGYLVSARFNSLLNAAREIKHEVTVGHLRLEAVMGADEEVELEEVIRHYDMADRYCLVIQKSGSDLGVDLLPVAEDSMQHRISDIQSKLEDLRKVSRQRFVASQDPEPGSMIEKHYNALYHDLLDRTGMVEKNFREMIARQQKHFVVILSLVMAAILLGAVGAFRMVRKFERRRTQSYEDLKNIQKKLLESEERYRSLIENIDLGIIMVDSDYRIVMANEAQADLFGLELDEIIGKNCYEVFKQKGAICQHCPGKRAKEESRTVEDCLDIERIDGSRLKARIRAFPLKSGKQAGGFIEVVEDVSEHMRTEEALAEEKERLAVTLRSIGDGVITTDTRGRVTMMNKVAEDLTGWPQDEALGHPLTEVFKIINELTRSVCENPVEKVLSSGRIVGLANHTALISRDGSERTIADSGSPIRDRESRVIGVVLVFRDVTQQLRMEKEMTKIKKLESIGVLAGGIAHDFNNILAGILGNLNLALFDRNMGKETRELLSEAEKASVRAKSLTAQLLTFSRGGEPVKETASLEEIIRDSAEFILHGDRVTCTFDIQDDLWLVDVDKGQISQVIQNLILNASHAMPEGGTIEVTCENIETISGEHIFLSSDQKHVKITVTDHGVGIPESFIDKIFDPYFSTKQEGSGLGLPISYSIINKHGGHILVDSKPGEGTVFTIYLPASKKSLADERIEEETRSGIERSAKVMVMDDEALIREMSKSMLERLGHEVLLVKDGTEAIQLYRKQKEAGRSVDLIIMDLTIPGGMGGREAVQEILAFDPGAKVIVSSGYSNDPVMSNYRGYGFKAVIFKPYKLQELRKVIDQVLS
ncbi:MAG: PAS domain S-box protein [Desulfurivibrionaceae bacterium]